MMNRNRSKSRVARTMPMVNPNAAAIDVGATMHMAAIGADRAPEPVRSFGTFTADLHRLAGRSPCFLSTRVAPAPSRRCRPGLRAILTGELDRVGLRRACGLFSAFGSKAGLAVF